MIIAQAAVLLGMLAPEWVGTPPGGRPAGPAAFLQQDDAPPPPDAPAEPQEEPGPPGPEFIDLGRLELGFAVGVTFFSSDFEADPSFLGGISFRAPLPWLSREVVGLDEDAFGLFANLRFTSVDRDFEPELEDGHGMVILADAGLDYTLYRDEDFRILAQAGLQYGYFGGVTGLEDGFAALLGLSGSARVAEDFWIALTPQISLGDSGDFLVLLQAEASIRF